MSKLSKLLPKQYGYVVGTALAGWLLTQVQNGMVIRGRKKYGVPVCYTLSLVLESTIDV